MKSKEQKRLEAQIRQDIYNSLTVGQKLARIAARPGSSTKETAKLTNEVSQMEVNHEHITTN